jgi:hypothetical protein
VQEGALEECMGGSHYMSLVAASMGLLFACHWDSHHMSLVTAPMGLSGGEGDTGMSLVGSAIT